MSFGFLVDAMLRINRVVKKDGMEMPNHRMMLTHVASFFGFLLSNIPEYIFFIKATYLNTTSMTNHRAQMYSYSFYIFLMLISQIILAIAFNSIINQEIIALRNDLLSRDCQIEETDTEDSVRYETST